MIIKISGISDIGKRRSNNEDTFGICSISSAGEAVYALEADSSERLLAFVCDGMGGMEGGEIASAIAKQTLEERFSTLGSKSLITAVEAANEAILQEATESISYKGMGCTCSALYQKDGKWTAVHVGDSRIYRWKAGKLTQLTTDHTVLERLKKEGNLPLNPHVRARFSHTLEQVLGTDPELLKPQSLEGQFQEGELYVICSDGLYEGLDLPALQSTINRHIGRMPLEELSQYIVEHSVKLSGMDNTTAVLLQVGNIEAQSTASLALQYIFHKLHTTLSVVKKRVALILTRKKKQFRRLISS